MIILISYFFLCVISIMVSRYYNGYSKLKIGITIFFISYILIVILVKTYDIYLLSELNSFDLNGDGIFGKNEITEQQQLAMNKVIHDTSRGLIFFTGLIYSLIHTLLFMLVLNVYKRIRK